MSPTLRQALLCAAVLLGTTFFLYDLVGDCFHPSLDEGIYLEGGERLLEGQIPYRDYFAFTGPAIYWMQASLEHLFGRNMPPLRLSSILSLAAMTMVVFALTTRFADWAYGLGAAFVYLGYMAASTFLVIVNHRWPSAGFACLALWAAVEAVDQPPPAARWRWALAGVAAALAAWTTPSFILGVGVYLLWLALRDRPQLPAFTGGVLLVSLPSIGWLAAHGALLPMIDNLLWVGSRYTKANAVPYAYWIGGSVDFRDSALSIYSRVILMIGTLRYAVAPILGPLLAVVYGWLAWRGKLDRPRQLLTLGAVAIFLTSYPRWDVNQLLYVMAPFAVLLAALAFRLPTLAQPVVASAFILWATLNYNNAYRVARDDPSFPTRAGMQRGHVSMLEAYEKLERLIPEGATLFAFPYLPSLGFALHTRNPIRYAFLQPGMMSKQDEAAALADLEKHAPRFILRQYFPSDQVLHTWPSSDRATLEMTSIRQFIDRRYRFLDVIQSKYYRVEVMELNP